MCCSELIGFIRGFKKPLLLNTLIVIVWILSVAIVTFIVELSTLAVRSEYLSLEFLAIEALGLAFSSDVGDLLTEETFLVAVSAIEWGPQLVVRVGVTWSVCTLALGFMERLEVQGKDQTLWLIIATHILDTIHYEFLGDTLWFNNDIGNHEWGV